MKQKLEKYVRLCNAPYEISFVLMIILFCIVIFTYEFYATCLLSGSLLILGILDMIIKNDTYYRAKNILEERYGNKE